MNTETAVSIQNLVKIFDDDGREHCVLPGLSLEISETSFVTFVGPTGSAFDNL